MQEEILNIDYHIRRMILKALNKYPNKKEAADALGVHERHLWRLIDEYGIIMKKVFTISENQKVA